MIIIILPAAAAAFYVSPVALIRVRLLQKLNCLALVLQSKHIYFVAYFPIPRIQGALIFAYDFLIIH